MNKLPDEPGLYWAQKVESNWDTIVLIGGVKPFLNYKIWNIKYPTKLAAQFNCFERSIDSLIFDKKIKFNLSNTDITVDKPGIYRILGSNLKLACITGTSPYMRCWVWDVNGETIFKHNKPWNLTFAQYIEKPAKLQVRSKLLECK